MALKLQLPTSSTSSTSTQHFLTTVAVPQLFLGVRVSPHHGHRKPPCFSSSSSSSAHIFLPLLHRQNQQRKQEEEEEEEEEEEKHLEEKEDCTIADPILKFFKYRTSEIDEPDPSTEGKISLQKTRKSSWHLAQFSPSDDVEEEEELEVPSGDIDVGLIQVPPSKPHGVEGKVVGEIMQKARALPENMSLGEALGQEFVGKVSEDDCVKVLECMCEEGLMNGCLYFYEWMMESQLVSPRACSVIFTALGRAGMGEALMFMATNLPDEDRFRDVRVYNSAISGLLSCRRYDECWKVYELMEANGVQPDHVTCSIMITMMRKKGDSARDAWKYFEKMNQKGVGWSLEVVGSLIKSFCDEGLKNEALVIQTEMEKRGLSSNVIIYNTIMNAYSKSNQIEEAEGLFVEMKAKGLAPSAATYNILMDAYSRRMQPETVEKLLLEMENVGLEPNVKSYTCLISAYGRQKKMSDKAADAFLRMKKVGINPSSHSYTALINAYAVSGWHSKAYMAFENMQKEGLKPSIETYTALLDAFRRAGDTESLKKIWKLMIRGKIQGTRVTFNILLDGFAKQGHYVEARDVISEFGKVGIEPSVMTYNMLINAYARGGQVSKLPQLLKEMAALNLRPDSITYSTMIYAYLRVRDFKRAFYYHKQMVKCGQVPDAKSYQKLRALLDVKAATKNRKDKDALIGIVKSSMGPVKKRKGKKDEFWKYKTKRQNNNDSVKRKFET